MATTTIPTVMSVYAWHLNVPSWWVRSIDAHGSYFFGPLSKEPAVAVMIRQCCHQWAPVILPCGNMTGISCLLALCTIIFCLVLVTNVNTQLLINVKNQVSALYILLFKLAQNVLVNCCNLLNILFIVRLLKSTDIQLSFKVSIISGQLILLSSFFFSMKLSLQTADFDYILSDMRYILSVVGVFDCCRTWMSLGKRKFTLFSWSVYCQQVKYLPISIQTWIYTSW